MDVMTDLGPTRVTMAEVARRAGHGGGDYFELLDFVDAIKGKRPCPIGIHEAVCVRQPRAMSKTVLDDGAGDAEIDHFDDRSMVLLCDQQQQRATDCL